MSIIDKIKNLSSDYLEEVISIRRHIHSNPELSFQEHNTSKFISEKLRAIGIEHKTGVVNTGIIAEIKGNNPGSKTIAIRADIDALPITEKNKIEYTSKNTGIMHACGHDAHTSAIIGAAKILNEIKTDFDGTVRVIFQPGEEKLPGGASLMIKEGVLKNPQPASIFGQHVLPELDAGKVGFKAGMYMASADEIYVTVKGKGGHAAMPHLLIDPVLIASHIIVALQQLVSRNGKPTIPSVLSFGKINAHGATNIIPDEVKIEGTFRTMDEEWRKQAHIKMKTLAETLAKSMGGECEFNIAVGYPFLSNNEVLTSRAKKYAVEFLGDENVVELEPRMGAEDFSFYSQVIPACFYRFGTRNEQKGITSGLHTSTFNIDESSLQTAMGLMAWIVVNELKKQ
jgi:amidohydrolase